MARYQGEELEGGQIHYLQFASSPSGVLEVQSGWNTLLVVLEQPFTVPRTDLIAKELQIEIPGWSVELEDDDTDPNEDEREDVTVRFLGSGAQRHANGNTDWEARSSDLSSGFSPKASIHREVGFISSCRFHHL
jgi:hypothetical protein